MTTSFVELCAKDVINMVDGQRLGTVSDAAIRMSDGCIISLTVAAPARILGLLHGGRGFVIPWSAVCKVGSDVILVQLDNAFFEHAARE